MKKKRNIKSGNKFIDFIIVLVCLSGIALSLYCFNNLVYKSLAKDTDVPIGQITFKKKSPRRKLQHENVWEYLKINSTIYEGDYILTEDLTEAQLFFKDKEVSISNEYGNVSTVGIGEDLSINTGSAEIHPNSMMRVGEDHLLHFISGSVSLNSGSRTNDVRIQVGENIYTLENNTTAIFTMTTNRNEFGEQAATIYVSSGRVLEEKASEVQKAAKRTDKNQSEEVQKSTPKAIQAGDVKTVQVKAEEPAAEKNMVSSIVSSVASVVSGTNQSQQNKKAAETNKSAAVQTDSKKFSVLIPPSSYSITQNAETKESIPFVWTNEDDIKIEFSYNSDFSKILTTEYFSNKNHKGSVVIDSARPDDVLYWRAMASNEIAEKNKTYSGGQISVNNPAEKDLEKALTSIYGKENSVQIQKAVQEEKKAEVKKIETEKKNMQVSKSVVNKQVEQLKNEQNLITEEKSATEKNLFSESEKVAQASTIKDLHSGKTDEELRLAEEAKLAEQKRIEEEKRKAEEARIAAEKKKAEEQRIAAQKKKAAEEARIAEQKRKAEEARLAEEKRKKEELRLAEEKKKAAEAARLAEEKKKAEEAAKLAEQKKKEEELRLAQERAKQLEEQRLAEEKRLQEQQRIEEELAAKLKEEQRIAAENRRIAEEARLAEEARIAEEQRLQKEKEAAEKALKEEEQRKLLEKQRVEEEKRLAEEKKRAEEAAKLAEQKRLQQEKQMQEEAKKRAALAAEKAFNAISPSLLLPANNKVYTETDFDKANPKIVFNWDEVEGAQAYKFEIKNSKGKVLVSKTLNTNKYTLSGSTLSLVSADGEYEWSVEAMKKIEKKTCSSQIASRVFRVQVKDVEAARLRTGNLITID